MCLLRGEMTTGEQRALPIQIMLSWSVAAAIIWWDAQRIARWAVSIGTALSVWALRGKVHAAAPARQGVPDYHAADARQSSGKRQPITA